MPIELQPKLLRVLQERVYFKLGSEKPLDADFRLISATNRDPLEAIKSVSLREDLYYRINTITIRVPPLRERTEDIQRLTEHFVKLYAEKYNRQVHNISQRAYARLFAHGWPGNVRELQNAMERAVLLCKTETIDLSELPFENEEAKVQHVNTDNFTLKDLSWDQFGEIVVGKIPDSQSGMASVDIFEKLESSIVRAALTRTNNNKQAAANMLGVYRPRLYHMIKKHGL